MVYQLVMQLVSGNEPITSPMTPCLAAAYAGTVMPPESTYQNIFS